MRPTDLISIAPRTRRPRRQESGTQIVELAIMLPLLLFLVLAAIDGGQVIRVHQVLNNAAREGARLSTQPEHNGAPAVVRQRVVDYAAENGVTIDVNQVQVNQSFDALLDSGVLITLSEVQVTHNHNMSYVPSLTGGAANVTLSTRARFENLY